MNGILNIDKPQGWTSFAVVAAVKRSCRERHAGHAGTLDPIATGVLPVCLGTGTRLVEYLMDATKTYRAQIELGKTTDTFDAEGRTVRTADASAVTLSQIEDILPQFRGEIRQVPPVYSALKQQGKPLYRYARDGAAVTPASRTVSIYELALLDWRLPVITLRVTCSKGTYIRSLANDIGDKLGCGGCMISLVREKYGPFDIKDAVSPSQVDDASHEGTLESVLYPVDSVLMNMPAAVLNDDDVKRVSNGIDLTQVSLQQSAYSLQPEAYSPVFCRAYSAGGIFIAVLKYRDDTAAWHPEKVFINNDPKPGDNKRTNLKTNGNNR